MFKLGDSVKLTGLVFPQYTTKIFHIIKITGTIKKVYYLNFCPGLGFDERFLTLSHFICLK